MAFRIVGVKTNYPTKEIGFFFEKGGAHAPVAPPLATALSKKTDNNKETKTESSVEDGRVST